MALSSQILAGSVSKSAPATPARMPPLLIFRDKKRVRHEDASAAEAQDALNAYYTKNGVYPKKFPDGIFTPSLPPLVIYRNGKHITHKDATAAEGQDAMNAYHRQHGRYPPKLEDGVFRVSLPSLIIYRDGKRIAYKEATTAEGQQAVDAYYAVNGKYPKRFSDGIFKPGQWVAHHESLLATLSDGDDNSDGDDESDGGESGGINNNYQNNGDENAATPAPVASPALIMPDMETNLPPIPDIQKSYYQLEQERLHGGQRPSYFPRWEWNKPIPTSFPYATYDSSSSEEDSDGEEERARGAKTRELNKAEASRVAQES